MPISRSPFPSPALAGDVQNYSPTTSQQRNQFDIRVQNNAPSNQKASSSRQEPYLYPEYDPLE